MKKIILLWICLLCSSCSTEPTPQVSPETKASSIKETRTVNLQELKPDMSRAEAEKILGEPSSVTDTATGTTLIWILGAGAKSPAPPPAENNTGILGALGSIAATTLGVFVPGAGAAASIGSQVYNVANAATADTPPVNSTAPDDTLIVTIEFKDNKAISIQRRKPTPVLTPPTR